MTSKDWGRFIALILVVGGAGSFIHIGTKLSVSYGFEQGFDGFLLGILAHWLLTREG